MEIHRVCGRGRGNLIVSAHSCTLPKLTPGFRKQLSYCSRLQLGEEGTTMDAAEMTEVTVKVEFLGNNGVTRSLLQIQTCGRYKIASSEEECELRSNIKVGLSNSREEVFCWDVS